MLEGMIDGFSGCLSTVSTLALEMVEMKRRVAWMYLGLSLALGQTVSVLILGMGKWVGGLEAGKICAG
jgi:fluoride exporter